MDKLGSHNKTGSFLTQGVILSAASILSRIIGLVYRIPLTAIIGKTGNDYYGTAFSIYNILLIISSYSLPLAISKMVATRIADGSQKDAKRVLKLGLLFAIISGGAAFAVVFFGADFFAGTVLKTENAAIALRVLSPALVIVAVLGVIRGFFQGMGTMVFSAISQILEQIVNAIVSVLAAYLLFAEGMQISNDMAAAYGASGGTLGTVSGAVTALIFLIVMIIIFNRAKDSVETKMTSGESNKQMLAILVMTIIPVLISTTLYNISAIIDQGIYKNTTALMGADPQYISTSWGVFSGQYNVIINIPLAIANSIAASIVPSLAASHKRREVKEVRSKIKLALRFISIVSFPCMAGFFVLGSPIMQLLFRDSDAESGMMLTIGAFSVIFYTISTLTNGILQGINRMRIPVIHAAISLTLQAVLLYVIILLLNPGIYGVIIANIFYSVLMCILNQRSVRKITKVRIPVRSTFIIPIICSIIMGVGVFLFYNIIMAISGNNTLATIISIIIGGFLYLVLLMLFGGIRKKDIDKFPKAAKVGHVLEKTGLLR